MQYAKRENIKNLTIKARKLYKILLQVYKYGLHSLFFCDILNKRKREKVMPRDSHDKNVIRLYLLTHINRDDRRFLAKTTETFSISKPTAYKYLHTLIECGEVIKDKAKSCGYRLVQKDTLFTYTTEGKLEEDRIFAEDILPLVKDYPSNVYEIVRYIFEEMMNNAIEHAEADIIRCFVSRSAIDTSIIISDNGIGIFNNIKDYFAAQRGEQITLDEAVDALFPGKLTTKAERHSGEGIFFSSRAADSFAILSEGKLFSRDSFRDSIMDYNSTSFEKGTTVSMVVANNGAKQLKEIFDMFADSEKGFYKTHIPIAHFFANGYPVSRSEARRLGASLDRFEEATLDFKDVPNLGQAFAHEMFVVFPREHEGIKLNVANANKDVESMISRVRNTK